MIIAQSERRTGPTLFDVGFIGCTISPRERDILRYPSSLPEQMSGLPETL